MTCRFGDLVIDASVGVSPTVVRMKLAAARPNDVDGVDLSSPASSLTTNMPFDYCATLDGWVERPMNPDEVQQLQTLVIEIVAARGIPFSLVEQAEVRGWFACFGLF
jgi:hypothetical protein